MLKYDQIVSTSTLASRIADQERERHEAMLRRANAAQLVATRDTVTRGAYVVRDPARPGHIELATRGGCSCRMFRVWGRCPHHALAIEASKADRLMRSR